MIRAARAGLLLVLLLAGLAALAPQAGAAGFANDGGAEWAVEQPEPPPPPPGVEGAKTPIGLGRIGDIAFWAPNRGALITAGNGSTIPAGVWLYNGQRWRELATVCGASDGRIAWAGPDEFWTVSDGRPGQAIVNPSERPPLEDNTLCHFAPGPSGRLEVVGSYASPAFLSTSYQPMHAAACISPTDCWFAGGVLPAPQIGAFQLHWNGHTVEADPYLPEGHVVLDMHGFGGRLYESVRFLENDLVTKALRHPPALRAINPEGSAHPFEGISELPLYGEGEFFDALDFLHLGATAEAMWAAAGPALEPPPESAPACVTVLRYSQTQYSQETHEYSEAAEPSWRAVLGPQAGSCESSPFPEDVVSGVASEPGTTSAWIALDTKKDANAEAHGEPNPITHAVVARLGADGSVTDGTMLPSSTDPYGPKGIATKVLCPAVHDCWLTTTQGWLLHLSNGEPVERDSDPVFASEEPIAVRPLDEGVPQQPPDAPPVNNSGLEESTPPPGGAYEPAKNTEQFATVAVPLLSHVHSRLVHGTTLELRFHLAVRARVRLLAKRRGSVVASTPTRTLKAGNRSLLLQLNLHRWPTKLSLQTHALAPLPTASTREAGVESVSTSLVFPETSRLLKAGLLP
jgi:hypothetical protein